MAVNKTSLVVAFFIAAVLAGIFARYNLFSKVLPAGKETFMQQQLGKPLGGPSMGPYDSVALDGGVSGWESTEAMPIVDGAPASTSADPNKLMHLAGNKISQDCCPSSFHTDRGCLCLTESDRSFMASRGGNKA
jgi:hypothetical protein